MAVIRSEPAKRPCSRGSDKSYDNVDGIAALKHAAYKCNDVHHVTIDVKPRRGMVVLDIETSIGSNPATDINKLLWAVKPVGIELEFVIGHMHTVVHDPALDVTAKRKVDNETVGRENTKLTEREDKYELPSQSLDKNVRPSDFVSTNKKYELYIGDVNLGSGSVSEHYTIKTKPQEETKMTKLNRRTAYVALMDNDAGLPAENSQVMHIDLISDGSEAEIIQQVIMDNDVKGAIAEHNKTRSDIIDEALLQAQGREVKLRPIKLKDLTWAITY